MIEKSQEKMSIQSQQKFVHQQKSDFTSQYNQENAKRKRNTKRKRKGRTKAEFRILSSQDCTIDQFVEAQGSTYFNLTSQEAKFKAISTFKRDVHIRDILGRESNIFDLDQQEQTIRNVKDHLKLIKKAKNRRLQRLRLRKENRKIGLNCMVPNEEFQTHQFPIILDFEYYKLLSLRESTMTEVERFIQQNSEDRQSTRIDALTKQILTLCKINFKNENELVAEIETMNSEDQLYRIHEQNSQQSIRLADEYRTLLVRKNMELAFKEQPIDLINYFRQRQISEKGAYDDEQIPLLNSFEQFNKYLKRKKPKKGKIDRDSLKTSCACCFSNYCESYNPMERCLECGVRVHQLCHNMSSTCSRCKYNRKTKEEKQQVPYCFICNRQKENGVALEIIKHEKRNIFAHSFCLLIHNLWKFEQGQIRYTAETKEQMTGTCKICGRGGLCLKTTCCDDQVHGLCAYLQGDSMSLTQSEAVRVRCCESTDLKKRLAFQRHYRLNFGNILYRQQGRDIAFIQSE